MPNLNTNFDVGNHLSGKEAKKRLVMYTNTSKVKGKGEKGRRQAIIFIKKRWVGGKESKGGVSRSTKGGKEKIRAGKVQEAVG